MLGEPLMRSTCPCRHQYLSIRRNLLLLSEDQVAQVPSDKSLKNALHKTTGTMPA